MTSLFSRGYQSVPDAHTDSTAVDASGTPSSEFEFDDVRAAESDGQVSSSPSNTVTAATSYQAKVDDGTRSQAVTGSAAGSAVPEVRQAERGRSGSEGWAIMPFAKALSSASSDSGYRR